jgi:hypothetical protein
MEGITEAQRSGLFGNWIDYITKSAPITEEEKRTHFNYL